MNLNELPYGRRATVAGIRDDDPEARVALLRLGLIPGTEVCVHRRAPLGDPLEVEVAGAHLALRRAAAEIVDVEPLEGT